jgi:hypothetical protein
VIVIRRPSPIHSTDVIAGISGTSFLFCDEHNKECKKKESSPYLINSYDLLCFANDYSFAPVDLIIIITITRITRVLFITAKYPQKADDGINEI